MFGAFAGYKQNNKKEREREREVASAAVPLRFAAQSEMERQQTVAATKSIERTETKQETPLWAPHIELETEYIGLS